MSPNFAIALYAAKLGFVLLLPALLYYITRNLLSFCLRRGIGKNSMEPLRIAVKALRFIHPYIGLLLTACVLVHFYFLGKPPALNPKIIIGAFAAFVLIGILITGTLLEKNRNIKELRNRHRLAALLFIVIITTHHLYR